MPYAKRKTKIHHNGGDQFHVYAAPILRQLAQIDTHWWIHVRQPDGDYYDPELFLVMKEYGLVGHDRIQTGKRIMPNLIDVAVSLYGLEETVVASQVEKVYFEIEGHDESARVLHIEPTHYELLGQDRKPMVAIPGSSKERRGRRQRRLDEIPALEEHRKRIMRRREYRVPAEKRVDQHLLVVERLRQQLHVKGLQARGSYQDIDVYTNHQGTDFIFEVKTGQSIKAKARNAIGQLLEYGFLYKHRMREPLLCIVIDQKPDDYLMEFLEYVGIRLCWTTESGFDCPLSCHSDLLFLLE